MSRSVLFNGSVLVRPGASTKIDASQFQNIPLSGIGIVGLVGEADQGTPRTLQIFTSPAGVKGEYISGNLVEAAALVSDASGDPRIAGGASAIVCYKVNSSTRSTYTHAGTHVWTSKQYGVATTRTQVNLTVGTTSNERIVTITDVLDASGTLKTETSPSLGSTGKFSIVYTGAGSAATLTVTATNLTTTVTGASGDNLNLTLANYASLADLLQAINATGKYTATALVTNTLSFNPLDLDAVSAVNIFTLASIYARNFDVADWINTNSAIVSDNLTRGQTGPAAVLSAAVSLAGGTRGSSSNTDWVNGFTAMRGTRVNQNIPLVYSNAVGATLPGSPPPIPATQTQGTNSDTYTHASILAAAVAHAKLVSSTVGRNECQAWAGIEGTKAEFIAAAFASNSEHLVLFGQKAKRARSTDGVLTFMPEWATACIAAGMRAGAALGEPLTWKFANCFGVSSHSSWSEQSNDDCELLALNGCSYINTIPGRGYRFDKVITTFTKMDNDAYTEESIVQIWKAVSYALRSAIQDIFIGRGGSLLLISTVPAVVARVLGPYRDQGAITDSVVNGVTTNAWRNVTYALNGDQLAINVTISPTPGINFGLITLVLVPAQFSGGTA